MEFKHILICGERGVGKSTLIKRLEERLGVAVSGFVTEKRQIENTHTHGVYINPAAGERKYCKDNMAGFCYDGKWDTYPDVFNEVGAALLNGKGQVVIMDELGFMEAQADVFTEKVMELLRGSVPVIAAVKARCDVPFLDKVRNHPNCTCYTITEENRDELFEELCDVVDRWK